MGSAKNCQSVWHRAEQKSNHSRSVLEPCEDSFRAEIPDVVRGEHHHTWGSGKDITRHGVFQNLLTLTILKNDPVKKASSPSSVHNLGKT